MIRLIVLLIVLLFAAPVYAVPITYQLVEPAQPTLIGSFTIDHTLANPFVSWQFQYVWPEATRITGFTPSGQAIVERFESPILGQTWGTDDGGLWNTRSHTLTVTNDDDLRFSFQLCYLVCGTDNPNAWGMSIYDPHYVLYDAPGVLYSGGGLFALVDTSSAPGNSLPPVQSVPEPGALWLVVGGLGVVAWMARSERQHGLG